MAQSQGGSMIRPNVWGRVYKYKITPIHGLPAEITVEDAIDLENNKVIFHYLEADPTDARYYDYCLYMLLSDYGLKPQTISYYDEVKDLLNFRVEDFDVNLPDDFNGAVVHYKNTIQEIFNHYNNIYLAANPYVNYMGATYGLSERAQKLRPLPASVIEYINRINDMGKARGFLLPLPEITK